MWLIPALIGAGLLAGRLAIGLANWIAERRSQVTPTATKMPPLLFGESDSSALETLMQGGEPCLKVEQLDNEGTLTLTVKRKRVAP
jgi:hypothetical protein